MAAPIYCFHFAPVVWLHITEIGIYIYIYIYIQCFPQNNSKGGGQLASVCTLLLIPVSLHVHSLARFLLLDIK